jgi:hypothetical protein
MSGSNKSNSRISGCCSRNDSASSTNLVFILPTHSYDYDEKGDWELPTRPA